jgi:hypothetical protein
VELVLLSNFVITCMSSNQSTYMTSFDCRVTRIQNTKDGGVILQTLLRVILCEHPYHASRIWL